MGNTNPRGAETVSDGEILTCQARDLGKGERICRVAEGRQGEGDMSYIQVREVGNTGQPRKVCNEIDRGRLCEEWNSHEEMPPPLDRFRVVFQGSGWGGLDAHQDYR